MKPFRCFGFATPSALKIHPFCNLWHSAEAFETEAISVLAQTINLTMTNSQARRLACVVAATLLAATAIFAFMLLRGPSGRELKTGKIETAALGTTIYHLQDGWLIKGLEAELGTPGTKTWLILVANRENGTRFDVVPGGVEWKSDDTAWALSTKGQLREASTEKAWWVTGVNVTAPRTTTGMLMDNDLLAAVKRAPSEYSVYDLYELRGPKVERPTR